MTDRSSRFPPQPRDRMYRPARQPRTSGGRSIPSRSPTRQNSEGIRRLLPLQAVKTAVASPSNLRLAIVWGTLVAGGLGLIANLFGLQVLRASTLRHLADRQQRTPDVRFVPRRTIVDRNETPLAVDRPAYTLYAHPRLFDVPAAEVADALAPLLNRPAPELEETFAIAPSGIRLADFLPDSTIDRILDLRLDGLEPIRYAARLYPQNELAAEVVGYVNFDGQGQAGVEYSQDDLLRRTAETIGDRVGETGIVDRSVSPFVQLDSNRLQLTLDSRLQRSARQALSQQMAKFDAKQGTVIVMDARDGSLLCLVSEPSYNPNEYYNTPVERFNNWALSDLYEPGSTFKPINVAIAIEAGVVRSTDTFYDPGQIFVDGWEIANYDYELAGGRGQISVTDILRDSSNVGMVRIMQQMSASDYYDWLERIGLGQPTQIDLPFEVAGQLKSREAFMGSPVEAATTSFGQGFAITPIQLVKLYGSLANNGYLVTPHVVRGSIDPRGNLNPEVARPEPRRVFSEETVNSVLAMMEEVVDAGTGQNAQIFGYRIAGKTGTAQKVTDSGGYSKSAVVTSFVAVFPVDRPRYVVFVALDEPSSGTGGDVAAPVARSVMEMSIAIEGIPPSSLE